MARERPRLAPKHFESLESVFLATVRARNILHPCSRYRAYSFPILSFFVGANRRPGGTSIVRRTIGAFLPLSRKKIAPSQYIYYILRDTMQCVMQRDVYNSKLMTHFRKMRLRNIVKSYMGEFGVKNATILVITKILKFVKVITRSGVN